MQRFFRARELASTPAHGGRYPISRATLWRWVKRGQFPAPVRLSCGVTAWPVEAIESWERERQAQTEGAYPDDGAPSGSGRAGAA